MIIWMSDDGFVLNADVCVDLDADKLVMSLEATVTNPQFGKPAWPVAIRTASDRFARWLRSYLGTRVPVFVQETPEIVATSRLILEHGARSGRRASRPSYLTSGIKVEHMAQFFESAATLYSAQPWRTVKYDTDVFCVRLPAIDVKDSAAIVIGQNRQSYGLLVFADYESYGHYVSLARAHAKGAQVSADMRFISLNYEHARDLDQPLRDEVKRFGWRVAGPTAYPWPIAVEENWATRPVLINELTLLSILAQALPRFLQDTRRVRAASATRASYAVHYRLEFLDKHFDIELEFPHPEESGDDAA